MYSGVVRLDSEWTPFWSARGGFHSETVHNLAFLDSSYPSFICPINSSWETGSCDFCNFRDDVKKAALKLSAHSSENALFLYSIYENLEPDIETALPMFMGEGNPLQKELIDPFTRYEPVMLILNSQQRSELYKHLPGVKIRFAPFNVYLSRRIFWVRSIDAGEFGTVSSWIFENESPVPLSLADAESFDAREIIREEGEEDDQAEKSLSSETVLRELAAYITAYLGRQTPSIFRKWVEGE